MAKVNIISGCYERFVLGHELKQIDKEEGKGPKSIHIRQQFAVKAHQGPVRCVRAKGGLLASGGDDDCVRVYDLVHGKDLGTLVKHEGTVTSLDIYRNHESERPTHLFSAGVDGNVNVWKIKDFKHMSTLRGHKCSINTIAVHPSGKIALTAAKDGLLCMWNLMKGRVTYKTKLSSPYEQMLLGYDDDKYASRSTKEIVITDLGNVEDIVELENSGDALSMIYPNTNCLMAGHTKGTVSIWDIRVSTKSHEFKGHKMRIKGIASPVDMDDNNSTGDFCPRYFVSASSQGDIKLWDTRMLSDGGKEIEPVAIKETGVRLTCLCSRSESTQNNDDIESAHAKATITKKLLAESASRDAHPKKDRPKPNTDNRLVKIRKQLPQKKKDQVMKAKLQNLQSTKLSRFD